MRRLGKLVYIFANALLLMYSRKNRVIKCVKDMLIRRANVIRGFFVLVPMHIGHRGISESNLNGKYSDKFFSFKKVL